MNTQTITNKYSGFYIPNIPKDYNIIITDEGLDNLCDYMQHNKACCGIDCKKCIIAKDAIFEKWVENGKPLDNNNQTIDNHNDYYNTPSKKRIEQLFRRHTAKLIKYLENRKNDDEIPVQVKRQFKFCKEDILKLLTNIN